MNLLLLGAASLPIGYMGFGFISLLVPPKCVPKCCPAVKHLVLKTLCVCMHTEICFCNWRALSAAQCEPSKRVFSFSRVAGSAGGLTAKDAAGNDVKASKWIETHKAGG